MSCPTPTVEAKPTRYSMERDPKVQGLVKEMFERGQSDDLIAVAIGATASTVKLFRSIQNLKRTVAPEDRVRKSAPKRCSAHGALYKPSNAGSLPMKRLVCVRGCVYQDGVW